MAQRPPRGFTYLGLMILITIIGLVGAAGLKMGTLLQRAAAEEELLEIGAQFSEALRSYAAATPQGQLQQPPNLQALLKDTRFPNPRRHLRKIFVDPVTGKAEWGIMYLGDKVGVIGVYSLSTRRPLKIANFDIRFQNMDNRERISDWKFLMAGGDGVNPANSMTGTGQAVLPKNLFHPGADANWGKSPLGNQGQGTPPEGQAPLSNKPTEPQPEGQAPLGNRPIEPPPELAPVQETPVEEAKPAEGQPMEAPPEEEKEKEKDAEEQQAQDDANGTAKPEVTPPPQPRKR
jgi:type II secretory pathway pseudopilin PulG